MSLQKRTIRLLPFLGCICLLFTCVISGGCGANDEEERQQQMAIEGRLSHARKLMNDRRYVDALKVLQELSANKHLTDHHRERMERLKQVCAQAAISEVKREEFDPQGALDSIPPAVEEWETPVP